MFCVSLILPPSVSINLSAVSSAANESYDPLDEGMEQERMLSVGVVGPVPMSQSDVYDL